MDYLIHLAIMVGIYTILNVGLNLLMGFTGVVSVMQASFYGIGAYISALLALRCRMPFFVAATLASVGAGLTGYIIGRMISRFKGDYLALVTFGIGLIFYDVFNNWVSITKGPMGLPGIPQPFSTKTMWLFFVMCLVILSLILTTLIAQSPLGRLLKAIRDDEELASVLGRDIRAVKALVFMLSAVLAGLGGAVYAHYITFIDPTSFTIMESVTLLAIVVVGGMASIMGSVLGALFVVLLPELLRFVGLPVAVAAALRQTLFGLVLVLAMLYRPQGLLGTYRMSA